MLAVLKSDVLEVCNYTGFEGLEHYPNWMHAPILDNMKANYLRETESPIAIDDWFIFNPKVGVKRVSWETFASNFVMVDDTPILAGLLQDAVEVVEFHGMLYGDWESYPKWVMQVLEDSSYNVDGVQMFADAAICPGDVFLRNKTNQVAFMDQMDFEEQFYVTSDPLIEFDSTGAFYDGDWMEWQTYYNSNESAMLG